MNMVDAFENSMALPLRLVCKMHRRPGDFLGSSGSRCRGHGWTWTARGPGKCAEKPDRLSSTSPFGNERGPSRAGFGLTTSVLEYSIGLLALILLCSLLVCLPGRFQPLTCRNWCEAASSALSSSSEIRITVARTPAELQVCREASADAVVSV